MDLVASYPNHMNPPLSYLDPTNVGKLTVYAGITPVSVGGDSIGGTIIAETAEPAFAAPGQELLTTAEIGGFYRSNGDAYGGNLSATAASENLSLTYTGAISKADNYKAGGDFKSDTAKSRATGRIGHTLPLDEVGSTAYETRTQTLGIAFKEGNHLIEAKFGLQDVPEQLYPNQRMDMLDNEQKRFNLRYRGQFDGGALDTRVFYETVDHFMDFGSDKRYWYGPGKPTTGSGGDVGYDGLGNGYPCSPISGARSVSGAMVGCAAGMPMYTESKTVGLTVSADVNLGAQDLLRLGGQYLSYRLGDWWTASGAGMWPGTFDNINDGQRDRFALYGEWESQISPPWTTLLGVRYERVASDAGDVHGYSTIATAMGNQYADANAFNAQDHKRTDNNVDVTALGRYTFSPTADIEFGVARKVRSPNLYERYTWSTSSMAAVMNNFVGDGNGYIGNLDLEPEKAHTARANLNLHSGDRSWELKATPFYTQVTDYIDAVRCAGGAACTAANATTTDQFVVLEYVNQSARLYGIDVSGRMPLTRNEWGRFGLTGLLNYTNGKNRDTDDELYNVMPLNAKLALTHQLAGWDNTIEFVGKAESATAAARGPLARLALAGFACLQETSGATRSLQHCGERQDVLERTLRQGVQKEQHRLESGLITLASIGSTAPFVGLFGTVWGIMHALQDISRTGQAGLDVVAGPIGEALIATAIGIATAIPAVLAYNYGLRRLKLYVAELDGFATDFLHLSIKAGFQVGEEP